MLPLKLTKPAANCRKGLATPVTPIIQRKERKYIKQRATANNIRVTEGEIRKMETAAKKCGVSLSAYLRKLGLGKEVQATLPQEFYEAYRGLTALRDNFKSLPDNRISDGFDYVVSKFLKAYHSIGEPESASDSPWQ